MPQHANPCHHLLRRLGRVPPGFFSPFFPTSFAARPRSLDEMIGLLLNPFLFFCVRFPRPQMRIRLPTFSLLFSPAPEHVISRSCSLFRLASPLIPPHPRSASFSREAHRKQSVLPSYKTSSDDSLPFFSAFPPFPIESHPLPNVCLPSVGT